MSGVSHALTLSAPLRYERVDEHVFAVDGTPTDCVNLAVANLLPRPPELVVSGINRGKLTQQKGEGREAARGRSLMAFLKTKEREYLTKVMDPSQIEPHEAAKEVGLDVDSLGRNLSDS